MHFPNKLQKIGTYVAYFKKLTEVNACMTDKELETRGASNVL